MVAADLKSTFESKFKMGVAINGSMLLGPDNKSLDLAKTQFNSLTLENGLKWERVHPQPNQYNFDLTDKYVDFGEQNNMQIVGHVLVWHNQTPDWVFRQKNGDLLTRKQLLERLKDHIQTVVGRYRGRIHGWDVVNEAIKEDGTLRDTLWREIIGDDYIEYAFRFAHEADPEAELYYNDYNMHRRKKSIGAVKIAKVLKRKGLRIDGIGMQAHWGMDYPMPGEAEAAIKRYRKVVPKVMITELDIAILPKPDRNTGADITRRANNSSDLDPYTSGLPMKKQQELADRYAHLFKIFLRYSDSIDRVTFWGLDDGHSWRNDWPVKGRTSHPLLFDRDQQPKPAFDAVIQTASENRK